MSSVTLRPPCWGQPCYSPTVLAAMAARFARHVIDTILIAFYEIVIKTDATVTKCGFTVNNLVSMRISSYPSHISLEAKVAAYQILGSEGWWFKHNKFTISFPGYDEIQTIRDF